MSRYFLKPLDGKKIPSPDHDGADLPDEGAEVEVSTYWNRRIEELDVERGEAQPATKAVKVKGEAQ